MAGDKSFVDVMNDVPLSAEAEAVKDLKEVRVARVNIWVNIFFFCLECLIAGEEKEKKERENQ